MMSAHMKQPEQVAPALRYPLRYIPPCNPNSCPHACPLMQHHTCIRCNNIKGNDMVTRQTTSREHASIMHPCMYLHQKNAPDAAACRWGAQQQPAGCSRRAWGTSLAEIAMFLLCGVHITKPQLTSCATNSGVSRSVSSFLTMSPTCCNGVQRQMLEIG